MTLDKKTSYVPVFLLCVFISGGVAWGQEATGNETGASILSTLDRGHPRLMLTDKGLRGLKAQHATDDVLRRYVSQVLAKADGYCDAPMLRHDLRGPRLLHVSRACVDRIYALGLAWRWPVRRRRNRRVQV